MAQAQITMVFANTSQNAAQAAYVMGTEALLLAFPGTTIASDTITTPTDAQVRRVVVLDYTAGFLSSFPTTAERLSVLRSYLDSQVCAKIGATLVSAVVVEI